MNLAHLILISICAVQYASSSMPKQVKFQNALVLADVAAVQQMLLNSEVDPGANDDEAIRFACANGYRNIVEVLLGDSNVDPAVRNNEPLRLAVAHGHEEIVELLVADERVDPNGIFRYIIHTPSADISQRIFDLLLSSKRLNPAVNDNEAIRKLVDINANFWMFLSLLSHVGIDPNVAVPIAYEKELYEHLRLLLSHPRAFKTVNFASRNADHPFLIPNPIRTPKPALSLAITKDDEKLLKFLLTLPKISPGCRDNEAIRMAAADGRVKTFKLLYKFSQVDPAAKEDEAFRSAVKLGRHEIAVMLLNDHRVNPAAKENEALRIACIKRDFYMVDHLLCSQRVNPNFPHDLPLLKAVQNSAFDIVDLLLNDSRLKPNANGIEVLKIAVQNNDFPIVRRLLCDARFDPAGDDNAAIRMAAKFGYYSIVRLLLTFDKVDVSARDNEALLLAKINGHVEVVELLQRFTKASNCESSLRLTNSAVVSGPAISIMHHSSGLPSVLNMTSVSGPSQRPVSGSFAISSREIDDEINLMPLPVNEALKRKRNDSESKTAKECYEMVEAPPKRTRRNSANKKAEIGDSESDTDDLPRLPSFTSLCDHMRTNRMPSGREPHMYHNGSFETLLTITKQRAPTNPPKLG